MQGSSSSSCVNPSLAVAPAPPVPGADGPPARRIVVAHRLPLRASPDPDSPFGFAFSLDPDALSLQLSRGLPAPVTYIGTLPASAEFKIVPPDELDGYLLEHFSCLPVHLDGDRHAEFYDGFCKHYLWPLLHYMLPFMPPDVVGRLRFDAASYRAFIAANRQFADRVIQVISPDAGDLVIVHDYHLWALPTFLRRKCPRAGVGFFLHSPFPSAEIFRSVPVRNELLRGLLNADLVGFHTFDYAHQFVSCCLRLLGISNTSLHDHMGINYLGRTVLVKIFSVGVDMGQLRAALASPEAAAKAREIAEAYRGRVIMVGVDDVDLFKGVGLKLLALEKMLEAHNDMIRQVVLVQINNPARSRGRDVAAVRVETRRIEQRINNRFGVDDLIVTIDGPVPMCEKVAYYAAADCCVVSAVRDGLNRIPYFYTVCREEAPGARKSGAVVLSEFAGCSASLGGAIRVNPWNPEALAEAMRAAVTMGAEEKQARHRANYSYLSAHDVAAWARSFDEALQVACRDHSAMRFVGLGFGMSYRAAAVRPSFQMLTAERVRPAYRRAARRLILLGYDGAMVPELLDEGKRAPSGEVLRLLDELWSRDDSWQVSNEHQLASGTGWEAVAERAMRQYTEATHGSYMEMKETAMAWHYQNADPVLGPCQAKELHDHLVGVLADEPASVAMGSYTVEVNPQGVSKGVAVEGLLAAMARRGKAPDLVLCAGDGEADEVMFAAVARAARAGCGELLPAGASVFACTVGKRASEAAFYVDEPADVVGLLAALVSR
ncbi:putative alpha,alpha-trehalose-phosphate synthase [Panicum miliaceum]|uniref:Alpha,alpha-trehalose-phosphate synthase n=1 Tax=Panicum miliaceum TaxID=4540 RepID=A0A3L6RRY5_PANMI|nr:putative alpha,alpha-trehalose-phosphate synthase [Panicum miliaceum]